MAYNPILDSPLQRLTILFAGHPTLRVSSASYLMTVYPYLKMQIFNLDLQINPFKRFLCRYQLTEFFSSIWIKAKLD